MNGTFTTTMMASLVCLLFLLNPRPGRPADEPFRQPIISVEKNLRVETGTLRREDVTPDCPVDWCLRKYVLHGGKQEGVDIIVVNNGKLTFTVIPTRGMGVLSVKMGDIRLGWDSPLKEVVHPKFINLQSRDGLGWLQGFNEWMCRCGLESNGHPGPDTFINNVGEEATMQLTLHGKIANLPAQEVEVIVDRKPPYRIRIRGRVDERMFYGPKLELQTEISTEPGASTLRISDVVTNKGAQPQEFQMLYHCNFGRPLLEAGSTFVGPVKRVLPFNEHAAECVEDYATYQGPTLGFVEKVYLFRLFADNNNRTTIMLQNKKKNRAVSMSWSLKQLPYLTVWKNTAAENDGYVTGLEPGTNYPNHRSVERRFGRVPKLAPGASHAMTIDFGMHVGAKEVKQVRQAIATIQGDRTPIIDHRPQVQE